MAAVSSKKADYTPSSQTPVASGMAAEDSGRYYTPLTKEAILSSRKPPVPVASGMAIVTHKPSSVEKVVVPVYRSSNFFIDASNTKDCIYI